MRGRRLWVLVMTVAVLGAGIAVTVVWNAQQEKRTQTVTAGESTPTPTSAIGAADFALTFPTPLPVGYNPINTMVGDTARAGVWFWTASATDSRVFFWDDASQKMQSWVVGVDEGSRLPAGDPTLALDDSGNVWLGAGTALYELPKGAGELTKIPISLPSGMPSGLAVKTLAARDSEISTVLSSSSPDGSSASTVAVMDTKTKAFSTLSVPDGFEARSLAYSRNGSLAVGLKDLNKSTTTKALLLDPSKKNRKLIDVVDSSTAKRNRLDGSLVFGQSVRDKVDDNGTRTRYGAGLPAVHGPKDAVSLSDGVDTDDGDQTLPDGRLVGATNQGIAIVDPSGLNRKDVVFPTFNCSRDQRPDAPSCPSRPRHMTIDGAGNIWVTVNGPQQDSLGVIRTSTKPAGAPAPQ